MTASDADRPRRCDLLITGATVLAADGSDGSDGTAGDMAGGTSVVIDDGRIVALVDDGAAVAWIADRHIDAAGAVVAPGFVDGHVHLGAHLGARRPYVRPSGPGPFSGAGETAEALTMVAGFCSMEVPDEVVAAVLRPVFAALLLSGYTGVVDAGGPRSGGAVLAAAELGIRAAIGPSLADRWYGESGLVRQADHRRLLDEAAAFITAHDGAGDGRVRALAGAVHPLACSDELLAGLAELAAATGVPVNVHTNISDHDVVAHREETGATPTARLAEAGLLTPACTLMHVTSLTDDDLDTYRRTGVTANHNPVGNALHGFGVTAGGSVRRLLDAGVPVVLGTDWAPAVTSPFELVRAALMLQRDHAGRDDALLLEEALTMASAARASLGAPGPLGAVAPGHLADLVVVDQSGPHHLAAVHPVPTLALHARSGDVRAVVVAGRVVVDDGRLVHHDAAQLLAAAVETLEPVGRAPRGRRARGPAAARPGASDG